MSKPDGRETARHNEFRVLKSLHKYGWLRTRDLAAIHWMPRQPRAKDYRPIVVEIAETARRMAQRTLARLRNQRLVIWMQAPDGSTIYGLSDAGARKLVDLGLPAKPGKNQVRRVSLSHFHHRRIANEVAIVAGLQGYRVSSETEIASGIWFGGKNGVKGKKPDFLVRDGNNVYWGECERSRRRQSDYQKLLIWLQAMWPAHQRDGFPADLPGGNLLQKVVFVCESAFVKRLIADLLKIGWTENMVSQRILAEPVLYVTEAKFLLNGQLEKPALAVSTSE